MSFHNLHIFAKNRDAVATQKGYSYQQLKTLEDWIENRIVDGEEEIYCDFEDDIFTRDLPKGKTTFKQIKLYSTDFSFSSEGVKKAISHFFSLYIKGEYSFDNVEFHFETNVSVVGRTVKDNDAALLKEWSENQESISNDLLRRIRVRVKKILGEYVEERVQELSNDNESKSDLQKAKITYDSLKDEDFDAFIRCIKWRFDGEETNLAVERILSNIENLIPRIPLPLDDEKIQIYLSLLVNEVFQRSIQDDPEERKLTKGLLDSVLLNAGEKEDKWYAEALQQFKGVATVEQFYPGEFQRLISAANYCRWNQLDEGHKSVWLKLLNQYIQLAETPIANKRKAIYEYLFLKIGHDPLQKRNQSAITEDVALLQYYFDHWNERGRLQDIEDDIVLLQLVKAQVKIFGLAVNQEVLSNWEQPIRTFLDNEAAAEMTPDRLCELLELRGHLAHQENILDPIKSYKAALEFYRKISPLLEKAQYYSLARLYAQMKQMIKMLTKYDLNDELIDMIDKFMIEIQPYAEKTGLRHKTAHDLVERGVLHIKHHDLSNYLKALELFHRAKSLWRLEFTKEGYILSLLGIAQVYEGLGMSYASKYYSLIAFWSTWHFSDPTLYKHLQKAIGQIQHVDYKHGSWMNAIEDFNHYLYAKREFDEKGFEMINDESYQRLVFEMATVIHAVPLIHPNMVEFIESLKPKLGFVWTEQLQPVVQDLSERIKDVDSLKQILSQNLIDLPLNDIGPVRNIQFNALGNDWHIQFENNETMIPIGEEFVSFLQVTLCEIARLNPSTLNSGRAIDITIQQGHFQKQIIESDKWLVTIPEFNSKEQPDIQMHYSYLGSLVMAILQSISNLSKHDFNQFYTRQLLQKEQLGEKVFEASSYQRVFRNTIGSASETIKQKYSPTKINDAILSTVFPKWLLRTS